MVQLADDRVPTQEESRLLIRYTDATLACRTMFSAAVTQSLPAIGQILAQENTEIDALAVSLVERHITWGEAAQRQRAIVDTASAKLREVHL